jgi:hypothetical protein
MSTVWYVGIYILHTSHVEKALVLIKSSTKFINKAYFCQLGLILPTRQLDTIHRIVII